MDHRVQEKVKKLDWHEIYSKWIMLITAIILIVYGFGSVLYFETIYRPPSINPPMFHTLPIEGEFNENGLPKHPEPGSDEWERQYTEYQDGLGDWYEGMYKKISGEDHIFSGICVTTGFIYLICRKLLLARKKLSIAFLIVLLLTEIIVLVAKFGLNIYIIAKLYLMMISVLYYVKHRKLFITI